MSLRGLAAGPGGRRLRLEAPGLRREAEVDGAGRAVLLDVLPALYRAVLRGGGDGEGPECSAAVAVPAGRDVRVAIDCAAGSADSEERPEAGALARSAWDADGLRALPRPADAWSVLRETPGVVVDRVTVGGSGTAVQSLLVSRGDPGTGAVWTLDGVDVTDPAVPGATLVYPPFDALEEVVAQAAGADVHARTPGVQVGLELRAPSARPSGSVETRFASDALQSDNQPATLEGRTLRRDRTQRVLDLAAEAGGPVGERLWLWGSASRYALDQAAFTGHDQTLLTSTVAARARLRAGSGSSSLLVLRNEKTQDARDPVTDAAPEARWRQSGPTWLLSLRDERDLGRVRLHSRLGLVDGGFRLDPAGGAAASSYEDVSGTTRGSYATFETERRRLEVEAEASGRSAGLGFEHELAAGLGYRRSPVRTTESWPGNGVRGLERGGVFFRTFRLTGFAVLTRDLAVETVGEQWEGWLQDTARRGRLTLTLGLRLDRLSGSNGASSVAANREFPALLPAASFAGSTSRFAWLDLLPRVGASVRLDREGRLCAGGRFAAYGAPLGADDVLFDDPLAAPVTETWYWTDRDGDHTVDKGELDTVRGRIGTSGIDPDNPGRLTALDRIDPGLRSPRTWEAALGLAWAPSPVLALSLETGWRRLTHPLWSPLLGVTSTDYVATGAVTGELFGEPYSRVFYAPANTSRLAPGYGRLLTNREGYAQESLTVTLDARGRAGRRLQWRAWGAYMDGWERFADRTLSVQDPTPLDVEPLQEFGRVVVPAGGLGRGDVFVAARWMAGGSVLARLPLGLDAALVANARDGFPIPYFQVGSTGDPTAGSKNVLVAPTVDSYRLPTLALVDARLARGFGLGAGRLTVALDVFNLANAGTTLQVSRDVELAGFDRPREIVRPRVFRLGLGWRF